MALIHLLLLWLVLSPASAELWQGVTLLDWNSGTLKIHPDGEKLLSSIDTCVKVSGVVDLHTTDPILMNYYTKYQVHRQREKKRFSPLLGQHATSRVTLVALGKEGECQRLVLGLLSSNFMNASYDFKKAYCIMSSSSKHLAVKDASSEAMISMQALRPLAEAASLYTLVSNLAPASSSSSETSLVLRERDGVPALPPLSVLLERQSGESELGWDLREDLKQAFLDTLMPYNATTKMQIKFHEDVHLQYFHHAFDLDPTGGLKKDEEMDVDVKSTLDRLEEQVAKEKMKPNRGTYNSGSHFAEWLRLLVYKLGELAENQLRVNFLDYDLERYWAAVEAKTRQSALNMYSQVMTGVTSYGWLIQEDGGIIKALPSNGPVPKDSGAADKSIAVVQPEGVSPPHPKDVELLSQVEMQKLEKYIKRRLKGMDEDRIDAVIGAVKEKAALVFKDCMVKTHRLVREYCNKNMVEVRDAAELALSALKRTFPIREAEINERITRSLSSARGELAVRYGKLKTVEEAAKAVKQLEEHIGKVGKTLRSENEGTFKKTLLQFQEEALKVAEEHFPSVPMRLESLKAQINKAKGLTLAKFAELTKPYSAWTEWDKLLADSKKKLEWELDSMEGKKVARNKEAVTQRCRKASDDLVEDYSRVVVHGNVLKYPQPDSEIFDKAASLAVDRLKEYNRTVGSYNDIEAFSVEYKLLEDRLQNRLCGEATRQGDTVLSANARSFLREKWVQDATEATKNAVKSNPALGEKVGLVLQEQFFRNDMARQMSEALRDSIINAWCWEEYNSECPGKCYVWSSSRVTHLMDLAGLCEPDWWHCNPRYRAGETVHGPIWKEGYGFRQCRPPALKPCPSYWDRKGFGLIKMILRLAYPAVGVMMCLVWWHITQWTRALR